MCPSAPRVCSEPGGQRPVLSLSLDLINGIHNAIINVVKNYTMLNMNFERSEGVSKYLFSIFFKYVAYFFDYLIVLFKPFWLQLSHLYFDDKNTVFVLHLIIISKSGYIPSTTVWVWAHWAMAAILSAFGNLFSWMKIVVFWFNFHWSLFLDVRLAIYHHWFR